jgi:ABC-type multidrug transport system ATPase subunit
MRLLLVWISLLISPYHSLQLDIVSSKVSLENVTRQYPLTLARKLFSSVPYRQDAVKDLTICMSGLTLLTGASSSGKSTLLKLVAGIDQPTEGSVCVSTRPFYLDQFTTTLEEAAPESTIHDILSKECSHLATDMSEMLVAELCERLDLDSNQRHSQLSTSNNYQLQLARASLKSMTMLASPATIAAPIILLDEWLDKEPSVVIQKVQTGLERLADMGSVIVAITHYPDRWKTNTATKRLTLCRGEVLSLQ